MSKLEKLKWLQLLSTTLEVMPKECRVSYHLKHLDAVRLEIEELKEDLGIEDED
jgi:hypothetical protein